MLARIISYTLPTLQFHKTRPHLFHVFSIGLENLSIFINNGMPTCPFCGERKKNSFTFCPVFKNKRFIRIFKRSYLFKNFSCFRVFITINWTHYFFLINQNLKNVIYCILLHHLHFFNFYYKIFISHLKLFNFCNHINEGNSIPIS